MTETSSAILTRMGYPVTALRPGVPAPIPKPLMMTVEPLDDGFLEWRITPSSLRPGWPQPVPDEPKDLPNEYVFRDLWDLWSGLAPDWRDLGEADITTLLEQCRRFGAVPKISRAVTTQIAGRGSTVLQEQRVAGRSGWTAVNHVADVHKWLRDVYLCTRHLVASLEGEYSYRAWDIVSEHDLESGSGDRIAVRDGAEEEADRLFFTRLNLGLGAYRGGMVFPGSEDDPPVNSFSTSTRRAA